MDWTHVVQRKSRREGALVDKAADTDLPFFLATKRRRAEDFKHNSTPLGSREEIGDVFAAKKPGWVRVVGLKMNLEEYNITVARICCYVEYD